MHEVPVWQASPVDLLTHGQLEAVDLNILWFIGGEANQWYPTLYEGRLRLKTKRHPKRAITSWKIWPSRRLSGLDSKSHSPRQAILYVLRTRRTHAPHPVPKDWADKYAGQFDEGYDAIREKIFARQKSLGVIPSDAVLTAENSETPRWKDIPENFKPVLAREMEVYAGFVEYTDHHIGRIVDSLEKLQVLDNTLIYYIVGDNGASAEGVSMDASMK